MPKIVADESLCQGYANCVMAADDVFDLDDDGVVVILRDEIPEADLARVDAAARSCPVNALRVDP